jgi:Tfp pilus assembly protein PilP
MRSAMTLGLGMVILAATPALWAQANPAAPAPAKSTPQTAAKPAATKPAPQAAAKPGLPAATKPAPQTANPVGKPTAKPAAKGAAKSKAPVKRAAKTVEKPRTPGSAPAAAESEVKQARRDPFESLLGRQSSKAPANLPPGKLGLQVSTLRLDGIVRAPNGMIAVVSNPQSRTYFLREGDRLYDGSVEKISMDGVSFHEEGKDAFGKPVERQVNKRIYSSPGEQQ